MSAIAFKVPSASSARWSLCVDRSVRKKRKVVNDVSVCIATLRSSRTGRLSGPAVLAATAAILRLAGGAHAASPLPPGVRAVWDLGKAYRESSSTRERVCLNGLWRWQPAEATSHQVPADDWGYFKVPGSWPGITNYMQKDCQRIFASPKWRGVDLATVRAAWYQREITIPSTWRGRRVALSTEYLNSFAAVYVDGKKVGEIQFPAGEVELTRDCRPGGTYTLSLLVVALPLKGVTLAFTDTNAARSVKGSVARRGLCGDTWLVGEPAGERVGDVQVVTSVRNWQITVRAQLWGLRPGNSYTVRAVVSDHGRLVKRFKSKPFRVTALRRGRLVFSSAWKPAKLWDLDTPQNQYTLSVSLLTPKERELDTSLPLRFGFREFWIDGRDFYLNGTRIFLCAVPLDNAQVGAAWASYAGSRASLERLKSLGINFVYTHNYGCEPGSHLSFAEILRAADDVGMLVALSQPHFGHYDWSRPEADTTNGYARHAAFYVHVALNHPSVVCYATSHNATGYVEDMNPDLIDGIHAPRRGSARNVQRALRAGAIIRSLDPTRIVYHHSSGNLGSMHTVNFYPNWVPVQELSDWFEHWATRGVKPVFMCEYGAPFMWDWAMYRGWYKGHRAFGSAVVPWDFCLAEWNAQFVGDTAYRIGSAQKENLRWEAQQYRAGKLWHRWDYPHPLGSRDFPERYPVLAAHLTDNWRAFRTWGVSAISPWEYSVFWTLRPEVNRNERIDLQTDWDHLQRPGFSPDFIEDRYERIDLAYKQGDWIPTAAARAMLRNNMPLLGYIAGKPGSFTGKDHNVLPGEVVEKQLVVINNSREPVTATCSWSVGLPRPRSGHARVTVPTGNQARVPVRFTLPRVLRPGPYEFTAVFKFSTGETQKDRFTLDVLSPLPKQGPGARIAVFDPKGETRRLLSELGVGGQSVTAEADLSGYDVLVVGKAGLTVDGPAPALDRVRDGLKVLVFEQTAEALSKRLGFRAVEYGLRRVFRRVPDHPALAGLTDSHLHDWRGAATLTPPRLKYHPGGAYNGAPTVWWCGLQVPRLWRCGNRGNVASVLLEKPAVGDFLPLVDGGFSLQYSPLMEYRQGAGRVLFCQLDVTGRTEEDPAARRLAWNLLTYLGTPSAGPKVSTRTALYVGPDAGKDHLQRVGIPLHDYSGQALSRDEVLIVGRGGGRTLAGKKPAIARWLRNGGHLLALELEAREANTFLPAPIQTRSEEHIASWFAPPSLRSPFAGVSPADVYNRDPRKLPLVTGGAKPLGDGVLAQSGNAVFCQLAPFSFLHSPQEAPGFTLTDAEAVDGRQSALLTMATVPWCQFGQKVKAGRTGKTYTFVAFVKPLGKPATVRLEIERSASPWDRALRGPDTSLPLGRWTELHATFTVDKAYPEGWSAYVHCAQPEGRLRLDSFRLYEGKYVPGRSREPGRRNLLANPGFEAGTEPWFFSWKTEQQQLRKTYRRTAFLLTRLLGNLGVRPETPLLTRFSTPAGGTPRESLVKNGDFRLDKDGDGVPDDWTCSAANAPQARCTLEKAADGTGRVRLSCPAFAEGKKGSMMLAQHDISIREGQWYRLSFKARAEGLEDTSVTWTVVRTGQWRSLFDYNRFTPTEKWKDFVFLVRAKHSASEKTRFQLWFAHPGVVWLADVRFTPCDPPTEGRWTSGLYLDRVQAWDDPYRFFRW